MEEKKKKEINQGNKEKSREKGNSEIKGGK